MSAAAASPPPMERDEPAAAGCCGWLGKKRSSSSAEKKYALAPHTEMVLAEAEAEARHNNDNDATKPDATQRQPSTKRTTVHPTANSNPADEVHAIKAEDGAGSTPTKPKAAAAMDRAASSAAASAATQAAVSTPAVAAPSELCAEWSRAITALKASGSSGADKPATGRSPALDAFIAAQGFSSLLAALIALADIDTSPASLTSKPSLSLTPSGSFARQASLEQMHTAVELPAAVHVTSAAVGGSPPATSRWTRRQELRAQREQELVLAQLQQQQALAANGTRTTPTTLRHMDSLHTIGQLQHALPGNRVPLFEKHSSVDHTRRSSVSRMSAGASGDVNDEDVTNRRFSGKSPLGVQVTEDGTAVVAAPASTQFSLPLDLRSAHELNQRQQAHQAGQQPETAHTATAAAAAAHMDALVDPEVFRGLEALACSMGQQLVLANTAEMGAQMRAATASTVSDASSASSALASPAASCSDDENAEEHAERTSVGLIHPLDVGAWVSALALALNQLAASFPMLAERAAALLKLLGVASEPQAKLLPSLDASESVVLREHTCYLMDLSLPLLSLYALGSEPPFALTSAGADTLYLLPPRAWIMAQASDACVRALMPSSRAATAESNAVPQQEPTWFGALESLEAELRHTAQQLCYPTATAHAHSILSLRSAALALRKLSVGLRWLQQGLSVAAADGSPPPAFAIVLRLHPFLLHALMELFWARLAGAGSGAGSSSLGRDDEEQALRNAWAGWHACVACIADTISSVCADSAAWIFDAPVLRAVHSTLRFESATTLLGAVGPGVIVAVPPLVELLTALTSLAFDPVSQPLECEPSAAAATQLATVRAIDATARLVSSRPFLLMQSTLPVSEGSVALQPLPADPALASSPLLQLTWFWDFVAALFTPVSGCLFAAAAQPSTGLPFDDLCATSLRVQQLLVRFVADLIFAPGSLHAPYPCPWILDGTFVAAYLQMHYAALLTAFHAFSPSAAQETLALSHAKVLRCAAAVPSALAVESVVPSVSTKHVVRLSHVHLQLYHLGIVRWISAQISLEMECGGSKQVSAEAGSEMEALNNGGGGGGDEVQQLHSSNDVSKSTNDDSSKSDRQSGKGEGDDDEDEDGSEFSDISFSDSDMGFDEEHVPAAMIAAPKLTIVQGERHINEQFALGWDGQPLHPEPPPVAPIVLAENNAATQAAAAAAAELLHEDSRVSGSSDDDLGESGWGESTDSVANSPRAAAAVAKLVIPPMASVAEVEQATAPPAAVAGPVQLHSVETGDDDLAGLAASASPAAPVFMPAMSPFSAAPVSLDSYASLRARHLLYRCPALHAALIDLLLQLLLDPSNPAHALNALYVGRFPLQASAEQQRLADAFHVQQAALESSAQQQQQQSGSGQAYSASMDDVILAPPSDALPPLATNVLFALARHVNHSANDYLCARVVHLAATEEASRLPTDASRSRSVRRLTKLLFEQLFSTRVYANRTQIGRGRFAAVYSASYGSQPVALKQVEQPATMHDQMCVVDLFTEIAIMEVLGESSSGSGTGEPSGSASAPACVPLLDFGVGEGCIWIVMPLAECSAKSYKLSEAQRMAEEEEEEQLARDRKKRKKPSAAVVQEREKARLRSQTLIRSLLSSTLDSDSLCSVLEGSSLLSVISDLHRKILSSLALYAQVLQCASALQRHSVVHFDIKADNLLILAEEPVDTSVAGAALAPPKPIRVTLADFGEAMFIPQAGSLAALASSVDGENGGGGGAGVAATAGSRISRGTENIQSPEMLTLIRSLDVTDSSHDRRKANGVDASSDLWSLGALFYELVMHHYGSRDLGGMGGQGMLFEEAGGLPIFLQVTNASLPLIAEDKREMLEQPEHLGVGLLSILESFLSFVLAKEKTRRPSLDQIRSKFNSVVAEVVAEITRSSSSAAGQKQIRVKDSERPRESIDLRASLAAASMASPHDSRAPALHPDLSSCVCTPPPACWSGDVPAAFRCSVCSRRSFDPSAAHASLRNLIAREVAVPSLLSSLQHALDGQFVEAAWDSTRSTMQPCAIDAVQPMVMIVDGGAPPLSDALLTSLAARRVHFLCVRVLPADSPSLLDGEVPLELPAQLYLNSAVTTSYAVRGESLDGATSVMRDHTSVQLLARKNRACALIALIGEAAGGSSGYYSSPSASLITPLSLHAALRLGWTAMQV